MRCQFVVTLAAEEDGIFSWWQEQERVGGAIIPSTTERRSVCLTARSLGEKRRDSASANLFATDNIHSDESWSPSSSSTFFKRRSSLIMGRLDTTNAFVTCTTLELSTQSLNKDIPCFFTRSPSVPMSTKRIALSSLTEMHSALSFHSHIPWSCHCLGSPGLPVTSSVPPKPTSAASVCIIPLVGSGQIGRPSVSVLANFLHICRSLIY
jgi:hypothetical protein